MKTDYESDTPVYVLIIVLFFLTAAFFFAVGHSVAIEKTRREAVQQKQAHYTVDDEGKTTFVWGAKK